MTVVCLGVFLWLFLDALIKKKGTVKKMSEEQMMKTLLQAIGERRNLDTYHHCITRLRFSVKEKAQVDLAKINTLEGVKAAKFQGDELQVVIGADVEKYYQLLVSIIGDQESRTFSEKYNPSSKKSIKRSVNHFMDILSGVFVPVLPAITGAGMIKSLLALLSVFNLIDMSGDIYQVLNLMADCAFYFLPFFLAVTSARKFGVNEFLGLMIAGSLMYPTMILGAAESGQSLSFLGVNMPLVNYSGSVIPIILGVYLLSLIYKNLDRFIPKSYSLLVTSTVAILVTVPIVLAVLAPLGYYGGNLLTEFINWIFRVSGPIAGLVLGFSVPLIVMTGMHYAVNPIVLQNLSKLKYDFLAPLFFIANIAQAGATLGVSVKTGDKKQQSLALSTGISALFGITEPAMYGVNLREKTPFKVSLVAGGIGGFLASLLGVKVFAFVMPGLTGLPAYINGGNNLYLILVSLFVTFFISFLGTIVLWKSPTKEGRVTELANQNELDSRIVAPISGQIVALSEVPDAIFSEKIMGDGFAIIPEGNLLHAPITGVVSVVSETQHAIGITGDDGTELLIHLGIDTVKLDGQGFTLTVSQGQRVKQGQELGQVDWTYIKSQQLSCLTPVIFTNRKELPKTWLNQLIGSTVTAKQYLLK